MRFRFFGWSVEESLRELERKKKKVHFWKSCGASHLDKKPLAVLDCGPFDLNSGILHMRISVREKRHTVRTCATEYRVVYCNVRDREERVCRVYVTVFWWPNNSLVGLEVRAGPTPPDAELLGFSAFFSAWNLVPTWVNKKVLWVWNGPNQRRLLHNWAFEVYLYPFLVLGSFCRKNNKNHDKCVQM